MANWKTKRKDFKHFCDEWGHQHFKRRVLKDKMLSHHHEEQIFNYLDR